MSSKFEDPSRVSNTTELAKWLTQNTSSEPWLHKKNYKNVVRRKLTYFMYFVISEYFRGVTHSNKLANADLR